MDSAMVQNDAAARSRQEQARLERTLSRARFLEPRDREIIQLLARDTLPRREIATLAGITPSQFSRHVQRLIDRLHDPVVAMLIESGNGLSHECRQLGIEHFLQKKTLGELADHHQMTQWQVRQMIQRVRWWYEGRRGKVSSL